MTDAKYQCIGCGSQIQTENPDKIGYLPASALNKGIEKEQFYCQRCFRLRNYNELQDLEISDDVFLEKLSQIAEDKAYIINLVDIFDVEGSLISGLSRFIGNQPFAIVANKMDLLPKTVKNNRIKHWLNAVVRRNGLQPEDIYLISATNPATLKPLIDLIQKEVRYRNVYIVGVTNVGKSTLINQIIEYFGGEKRIITTSNHPGTTLDLIEIPINHQHSLIDTPGIIKRSQLTHYIHREDFHHVVPSKPIKPLVYQLNPGQTIFLGGLARIDYGQGPKMALSLYVSSDLYVHRTKLAKADEFYQQHLGELLVPPRIEDIAEFPQLHRQDIKVHPDQDIAISGLGWLTVNQEVELSIWKPEGIQLSRRDAII